MTPLCVVQATQLTIGSKLIDINLLEGSERTRRRSIKQVQSAEIAGPKSIIPIPSFRARLPCPPWRAWLITHRPVSAGGAKIRVDPRIGAAGSAMHLLPVLRLVARAGPATCDGTAFELCFETKGG